MFPILVMFAGLLAGWLLRATVLPSLLSPLLMPAVMVMLLCMGFAVGGNETLIHALPTLGLRAVVLALAATAGGVLMVTALRRHMPWPGTGAGDGDGHAAGEQGSPMRDSLTILGLFALGVVIGRAFDLPAWLTGGEATLYPLYVLMAVVGTGLGSDPRLRSILRSLTPRILLLPLANMAGTLAGVALVSLFIDESLWHCLAVGSGFAYYTLSSVLISQTVGSELGTVALMANIMRETVTLLCVPLVARHISPQAAISLGGASTMDTTLPVMIGALGPSWAFISILHAMVMDFSVPFWVLFFCSL